MLHHDRLLRTLVRALERGAVPTSARSAEWAVSGDCQAPVRVELYARKRDRVPRYTYVGVDAWGVEHRILRGFEEGPMASSSIELNAWVRCRKCDACARARRREWIARGMAETAMWCPPGRIWFGTLTWRPDQRARALAAARVNARRRGHGDFDALPPSGQFEALTTAVGSDVTRYFKRLRKLEHRFRYLCVWEAHQDGFPHAHVLLWEVGAPIPHAVLSGQWSMWHGHEKFRLCDPLHPKRAIYYACKYITKTNLTARVRASVRFGKIRP